MTDIVRIPFSGGDVLAVDNAGKPNIFLKPMIERLGIDFSTQLRKLKTRSWACVGHRPIQLPGDTQVREHVVVDIRTFLMLLATIDERRVSDEARPILIAYQGEVADAIEAYWTKGGAINTRATEQQLETLNSKIQAQLGVLAAARELVNPSWLEGKARHLVARALGEEPEVDVKDHPLTVMHYLAEKGVTNKAQLRSLAPRFGKRLTAVYTLQTGVAPKKVQRYVEEVYRMVACYTEADRPMFDRVWVDFAAEVAL